MILISDTGLQESVSNANFVSAPSHIRRPGRQRIFKIASSKTESSLFDRPPIPVQFAR